MKTRPEIIPSLCTHSTKALSGPYRQPVQLLKINGPFDKYKFSVENSDYVFSREPDRITVFENC
ncbi:MAG TPA: hypothetical protein VK856_06230 [Anaerolineaceae bacterium]|nr:hypothetical protein [Anaerolineaceae bacterium]